MQKPYEREQDMGSMSRSMLVVMILTMVAKVAGFLRESVMARQFGATHVTDAIKTALDLPCYILSIIVIAIAATMIPVYSSKLREGREKAERFMSNLFTVGLLFSIIILVITYFLLEPLTVHVQLRHSQPETQQLAIRLAKIMMPMGIFVFLSRMSSAYLQANFRFTIPALSQILGSLIVMAAILIAPNQDPTYVALGTVAAWAVQFAVHIPQMRRVGLHYRPTFDLKESGLVQIIILMVPVLISSAFDQLCLGFDRLVASQVEGDISTLDYANRLSTMVSAILLSTIATVLYPSLVRAVDDKKKFTDELSFGVNLNLIIALPATIALIVLCTPVVRVVYQRNNFTAENTASTAPLLACYAAGIFGVGLRELCNRCFYAYKDIKIPTLVGILVVVFKVGLNFALYPLFDAEGVAAATAISSLLSGFVLLFLLHRKRRVVDVRRVLRCLLKVGLSTAVMALVLFALMGALSLDSLAGMGLIIIAGIAVYAICLVLLRVEELKLFGQMFKRRMQKG